MPYVIDATGLEVKTFDEIVADLEAAIRASSEFPDDVNLTDASVLGQFIRAFADQLSDAVGFLPTLDATFRRDNAEGVQLDDQSGLVGIAREGAAASSGTVTLGGTPLTPIPAGSKVKLPNIDGSEATIAAGTTIGAGGTVDAEFTADATGPINYPDTTALDIVTPVAGWDTAIVNEPVQGAWALGRDVEIDGPYRRRGDNSFATTSEGTDQGLAAQLRALPSVDFADVISNKGLTTDSLGIPGKATRAVVYPATADGDAIAQVLFERWGLGAESDGAITKIVTDSEGNDAEFKYSIATELLLYVEVNLIAGVGYGGDLAVRTAAVAFAAASLQVGTDVDPVEVACYVRDTVPGVIKPVVKLGLAPFPTSIDVYTVERTEIALFDLVRTTAVVT